MTDINEKEIQRVERFLSLGGKFLRFYTGAALGFFLGFTCFIVVYGPNEILNNISWVLGGAIAGIGLTSLLLATTLNKVWKVLITSLDEKFKDIRSRNEIEAYQLMGR